MNDASGLAGLTPCPGAVFHFHPEVLQATAARFIAGFPGLVTYAVKANPVPQVLTGLAEAGVTAFDVASPAEAWLVRAEVPGAVLHYNNPVRGRAEIAAAEALGIASWSVDRPGELAKLAHLPKDSEIAVRLKLPAKGAAYDFGAKFGATPEQAQALLAEVARLGFRPAMTFHPGTQCTDPNTWRHYIRACADIARNAGVTLERLNVGGGFPAHRQGDAPVLEAIFDAIGAETRSAFDTPPALVCEPGRAMVADCCTLELHIRARHGDQVFLDDGLYGALAEWRDLPGHARLRVSDAQGHPRTAPATPFTVFGPTCDSLDTLPFALPLPADLAEGDTLTVSGMGAYSHALATGFNGYGPRGLDRR
ncbi:type III PLP-dependent enzyme [Mesobacterium sp. TK19101]|uniref:ornithine decarboxylase n=1 Tax=Mesobacterium hydrothermale TaxID=3111907 RepID=A0ABU6HM53_9RHOB|nr:type III PLP-dependent enzyme [Mesobacterium sp. TK19101]MEC3863441.1 type III PLP-dependent enzyme [Mesobacterium sp. TK19101]